MTGQTKIPVLPIAVALLVAGCLLQARFGYTHHDLSGHALGTDDAFISYRYACNLAQGHGLTFNPGERVEGYSNFSYVLLMTGACAVAESWLHPLSVLLNTAFSVMALLVFHGMLRRKLGAARAAAGALLFALMPTVWVWAGSGLETSLVTLLQLSILALIERTDGGREPVQTGWLALAMALLVFSRVDGFLIPLLAVVYLAVTGRTRPALLCLAATSAAVAVQLGFRLTYYGDFLPNTYYVKVSGPLGYRLQRSIGQLVNLAIHQGLGVYFAAIGLTVLLLLRKLREDWRQTLADAGFAPLMAVCWLGYFVYIGGDIYKERFLLVLYPLGAYLALRLTAALTARQAQLAAVAILALQSTIFLDDVRFDYTRDRYDRWVTLGRYLGAEHPEATIAVDAAGKVPYFSRLYAIDMFGLNDRHIARLDPPQEDGIFNPGHGKFDADYVLAKRPDLIVAWIREDLDVIGGMQRDKYRAAGYRVRYLVNSRARSRGEDILDVGGAGEAELLERVKDRYDYAVLAR